MKLKGDIDCVSTGASGPPRAWDNTVRHQLRKHGTAWIMGSV